MNSAADGASVPPGRAAIGVPHLVKTGVSGPALADVVALGTGLVLLTVGATIAIRAARGWWRLLAIPVAFLLVQFVMLPAAAAVYATNPPAPAVGAATPADRGLRYEDVTLRAADGVRLSGWYVPSTNRAAIVALHGAGNTRSNVLDQAAVLARHGYGVLLLDARGHGRSGGHGMDWGWYGNPDITTAVSCLTGRPDVDPSRIGALGLSMGGEEALTAAAAVRRIRAVVAEGATARVAADGGWLPHDLDGLIMRGEFVVQFGLADLLTGAPRPVPLSQAVAAIAPRSVMIIASGKAFGEIAAGRYYRDQSPSNVDLWELPDTGHTQGLATHPAQWAARVTSFLDRALLG